MTNIIGNLIIILAAALAGWYLYRKYKKTVSSDNPGCSGCSGCSGLPADSDKQNLNKNSK